MWTEIQGMEETSTSGLQMVHLLIRDNMPGYINWSFAWNVMVCSQETRIVEIVAKTYQRHKHVSKGNNYNQIVLNLNNQDLPKQYKIWWHKIRKHESWPYVKNINSYLEALSPKFRGTLLWNSWARPILPILMWCHSTKPFWAMLT